MKTEACPPQETLSAFARSEVSEAEAEVILEHVTGCPQCEETVVGLEKDADTVFHRLKIAGHAFPHQAEPELDRMVQAVKRRALLHSPEIAKPQEQLAQLEQLRDYRILETLGEGGMGTVYRALHTRLNKIVALKVLSQNRLDDESAINRFKREMSIIGQLKHSHIVQAHDAGEESGRHFLVMEYVDGIDLSELLRRNGPLAINTACEMIAQAAKGLQYAHENGLVHRDIKPSNLMLTLSEDQQSREKSPGIIKILDLGLARLNSATHEPESGLTTDGQVVGSLEYMAPEQGGDSHLVDIRADIYSLGATLFKLLTGKSALSGEQRTVMQKLTALATEEAPSVRILRPDVPERLAAVIARMLSRQPRDRYATPADVASALQPFCAGADLSELLRYSRGSAARPTSVLTARPESAGFPPRQKRRWAKIAKWFFSAAAMFAVVLTITTKRGTVEVESPTGRLPDDVKVIVTQGGTDVEVLQVDNHWRASAPAGKIQLALQGGSDQFELQDSSLTVSRFGKTIVSLRVKATSPAPADVRDRPVQPPTIVANLVAEKPFVLVRKEKRSGEFSSLYGAVSESQPGDVIEVHSHGRVRLTMPEAVNKSLHLRAGKGYRPKLEVRQPIILQQNLCIEDCDVDQRSESSTFIGTGSGSWEFLRCRFWSVSIGFGHASRVTLDDCIVDSDSGFFFYPVELKSISITNCAIRCSMAFLSLQDEASPVKVLLVGNTFRFYDAGHVANIVAGATSTFDFEATGNLFEIGSHQLQVLLYVGNVNGKRSKVDWVGRENLFRGIWYEERGVDGKLISINLAAWNKQWKQPEQNSQEISEIAFAGARSADWSSIEHIAEIRSRVEQIKSGNRLSRLGPDWSVIGVGDNYLRALASQGNASPKRQVRPAVHPDGPIVLIRNQSDIKGFLTLTAAIGAAESGDVIEIRTDDPIPGVVWDGKPRRLTLRAAAGYSPIINSDVLLPQDHLIVEGLTFRGVLGASGNPPWNWDWKSGSPPFSAKGSIERLTDCVFLAPERGKSTDGVRVWGRFNGEGERVPEIDNCVLPTVAAGIAEGKQIRIRNSVLASAWVSVDGRKQPGKLEILDCVFWTPDSGGTFAPCSIHIKSPLAMSSQDSLFVSPGDLVSTNDIKACFQGWTGSRNVYVKPGCFVDSIYDSSGSIRTLDELQKSRKTDSDSVELLPLSFDAENWKIYRERSLLYKPRGNGTDYGADIERLRNGLRISH